MGETDCSGKSCVCSVDGSSSANGQTDRFGKSPWLPGARCQVPGARCQEPGEAGTL